MLMDGGSLIVQLLRSRTIPCWFFTKVDRTTGYIPLSDIVIHTVVLLLCGHVSVPKIDASYSTVTDCSRRSIRDRIEELMCKLADR